MRERCWAWRLILFSRRYSSTTAFYGESRCPLQGITLVPDLAAGGNAGGYTNPDLAPPPPPPLRLDRNGDCSLASDMPKPSGAKKGKAILLGVGLDSDGHKRVTTGPNFALVGGSKETHEVMTEKVVKLEKLAAKGKALEEVSRDEFDDMAQSVGLESARTGAN